jgi:hypothetical protein
MLIEQDHPSTYVLLQEPFVVVVSVIVMADRAAAIQTMGHAVDSGLGAVDRVNALKNEGGVMVIFIEVLLEFIRIKCLSDILKTRSHYVCISFGLIFNYFHFRVSQGLTRLIRSSIRPSLAFAALRMKGLNCSEYYGSFCGALC